MFIPHFNTIISQDFARIGVKIVAEFYYNHKALFKCLKFIKIIYWQQAHNLGTLKMHNFLKHQQEVIFNYRKLDHKKQLLLYYYYPHVGRHTWFNILIFCLFAAPTYNITCVGMHLHIFSYSIFVAYIIKSLYKGIST